MISVVIPAYNAAQCIGRAIDSVLSQSFSDYEIIVVDDGSTDDTAGAVSRYGSRVNYIYQDNAGDGPARNAGIAAAKGHWIAFLDADDEWLPEKLQQQTALLGRNPDLKWCSANRFEAVGERKTAAGNKAAITEALAGRDYFPNYFTAALKGRCPIVTTTIMVHREVFEQVGVFDSCWSRCADIDLWWRIAHSYPRIGYAPEPLAVRHLDAENPSMRQRRLEAMNGHDARKIAARHLAIAEEKGGIDEFRPLVSTSLRKALLKVLFCGYKQDARDMVNQFPELFPWHWRLGTFLLTIFPKVTSGMARTALYLVNKSGFKKQVSRNPIVKTEKN